VGGSDPESLSSMRFSIPKGAQIRERAVTIEDYQALALQVPGVAKAVAYGQIYSAVNVTVAPVGGNLDSPSFMAAVRRNVQDYLESRILIGSKVYVEDAQWTDFWIQLDLHVLDGFSQEQTQKDVEQSIRNAFAFDNMDLEEKVTIGEIYRRATRIEGVDWVDVTALNTTDSTSHVVENIFVPFGHIARIALPTGEDTTEDETDDTDGLVITAFGGTITES
jgi:phage-related baseplate assembly protein